jgi:trigger factor
MTTQSSPLSTTTEQAGKDRVKLRVEVDDAALAPAITEVYRRWAGEIKVPGFRKGKVPRQLIDARVGPDIVREEALRDALPGFYREALAAEELEAIAPPEIDVVTFEAGSPIVFEATVDVRPEIEVPDLSQIKVEAPPTEVTDAELDQQLERLRDRFAELESVTREVRRGDYVLIDLKGYRHDELVEGASAPDFLYEVGSRSGPPKLDDELVNERPGAILKFTDSVHIHKEDEPEHDHTSQEEISFTVLLKEVKAKKLPALGDDFAKTVGEFDTLDELKDDLRTKLGEVKQGMVQQEIRAQTLEALVDAASIEAPERLVEEEFEHRLTHFKEDLSRAGLDVASYAAQTDSTELEVRRDIRAQAARSVQAELLLEEIARREEVQITDEEIGREIAAAAAQAGTDPKKLAEDLAQAGRLPAVAADIMRRKALDHVVAGVNVIGTPADEG